MIKNELFLSLKNIAKSLNALQIDFALVGGMALAFRAIERTTKDIDLAIAVNNDTEAKGIVLALQERGFSVFSVLEHKKTKRLATARLRFPPPAERMIVDLLFASCGIEPEIVAHADILEVLPGLKMKVVKTPHLLAMKILSMNDSDRIRDLDDARHLIAQCSKKELAKTRSLLKLITERKSQRGRNLLVKLNALLKRLSRQKKD